MAVHPARRRLLRPLKSSGHSLSLSLSPLSHTRTHTLALTSSSALRSGSDAFQARLMRRSSKLCLLFSSAFAAAAATDVALLPPATPAAAPPPSFPAPAPGTPPPHPTPGPPTPPVTAMPARPWAWVRRAEEMTPELPLPASTLVFVLDVAPLLRRAFAVTLLLLLSVEKWSGRWKGREGKGREDKRVLGCCQGKEGRNDLGLVVVVAGELFISEKKREEGTPSAISRWHAGRRSGPRPQTTAVLVQAAYDHDQIKIHAPTTLPEKNTTG